MLKDDSEADDMRASYDFSDARSNPYAAEMREGGANLISLERDLYEIFPDSKSVNEALRLLVKTSVAVSGRRAKRAS